MSHYLNPKHLECWIVSTHGYFESIQHIYIGGTTSLHHTLLTLYIVKLEILEAKALSNWVSKSN
jgi:hypothetical protein